MIEPGAAHFHVAQLLLETAQAKANAAGIPLDVGEFPHTGGSSAPDDPERLAKVTAHAIARIADKFAPLRKLSRNAEGMERKAGIVSDLVTAAITLYERNPETVKALAVSFGRDVREKRAAAAAEREMSKAAQSTQTNGGIHSNV